MTKVKWGWGLIVIGAVVAVGITTAAYGSAAKPLSPKAAAKTVNVRATAKSGSGGSNTLNISDEYGFTWTCQFNPFNASDDFDSFGPVYEELVYVDSLKNGATTPWLATAWAWSNDNKTLTFTIRKRRQLVRRAAAFSANDVLFTFNLLKKYPALDLNSDWSVLTSVACQGADQVVFNFKTAAVPYFYYIADQTPIVPEHIWSTITTRSRTWTRTRSARGRYVCRSCNGANIQYTKNPNYWQPGLPKIETVNFPSYLSNNCRQRRPDERDGPVGIAVHPEHHKRSTSARTRSTTTTGSRPFTTSASAPT